MNGSAATLAMVKVVRISQRAFCLLAGSPSQLTPVLHAATRRQRLLWQRTLKAWQEWKNRESLLPKAQRGWWQSTRTIGVAEVVQTATCLRFHHGSPSLPPKHRGVGAAAPGRRRGCRLQAARSVTIGLPSHCPAQRTTLCALPARLRKPLFHILQVNSEKYG